MSVESPVSAAMENAPAPMHRASEADVHAANAEDTAPSMVTVQHSMRIRQKARKKKRCVRVTSAVQMVNRNAVNVDTAVSIGSTTDNAVSIETAAEVDTAVDDTLTVDAPRRKTRRSQSQNEPKNRPKHQPTYAVPGTPRCPSRRM